MNKIYKVVWSKAKHCYVVTSELAKRQTKGCGARSLRMATVSLGVAASLLCSGAVLPIFGESVAEAASSYKISGTVEKDGVTKSFTEANFISSYGGQNDYGYGNQFFESGEATNAQNYHATITSAPNWRMFVGAGIDVGTVSGNTVTVNGDSTNITQSVIGGYAIGSETKTDESLVTQNEVTINAGTYYNVYGATMGMYYAAPGKATDNTVTINGGMVKGNVWGGDGDVSDNNKVYIKGGTVKPLNTGQAVSGGVGVKEAINNKVYISGGTVGTEKENATKGYTGDISGGSSWGGKVDGNQIFVTGGTVHGVLYGGKNSTESVRNDYSAVGGDSPVEHTTLTGTVSNNEVQISGGTVNGNVYGGMGAVSASGNTVTIKENAVLGKDVEVYGGTAMAKYSTTTYTWSEASGWGVNTSVDKVEYGDVTNNTVNIGNFINSSANDYIYVYGGKVGGNDDATSTKKVNVSNNTVTVDANNSTISYVYGGVIGGKANGDVKENKVEIKSGTVYGVFGGLTTVGDATGNSVSVIDGDVKFYYGGILGGSSDNGDAVDNTVTISGGTLVNTSGVQIKGGEVYDAAHKATGNKVNISNGTIGSNEGSQYKNGFYVIAGDASTRGGNATDNAITISGGSFAGENTFEFYGGKTKNIFTSHSETGEVITATVAANKNTVEISGGTFSDNENVKIYGAYSSASSSAIFGTDSKVTLTATVDENKVKISGGTFSGNVDVYGGYGTASAGVYGSGEEAVTTLTTNGNTVEISGGTFSGNVNVYGGYGHADGTSESGGGTATSSASADNNEVIISGGTINGYIAGGWATESASGNTVTIKDNAVIGENARIYGGYAASTVTFGTAANNTVNILKSVKAGALIGGLGDETKSTGNTLNLGAAGVQATDSVADFQTISFTNALPWDNGKTVLAANNFDGDESFKAELDISAASNLTAATSGQMTLLASETDNDLNALSVKYDGGTAALDTTTTSVKVKDSTSSDDNGSGVILNAQSTHTVSLDAANNYKNVIYKVESGSVTGVTFNPDKPITFSKTEAARDLTGKTFAAANTVDAENLKFSETKDALKATDSMTLVANATGITTDVANGTGKTVAINYKDDKGIAFVAEASGDVTAADSTVKYTVGSVTVSSVDLSGWNRSDTSAVISDWTGSNVAVETGNFAAPEMTGPTLDIVTASEGFFGTVNGNNAYGNGDPLENDTENGITVTGYKVGGVKAENNGAKLTYYAMKKTADTLDLEGIAFADGQTARTFTSEYDLANAIITASDTSAALFTNVSAMKGGQSMTLVDASGVGTTTIAAFADKKYETVFDDKVTDNLNIKGTQTDWLKQDGGTKLVYTVGDKLVTDAILSGDLAWDVSAPHYTNTDYKFDGNTTVNVGVNFTATVDPLTGTTKSMTLIKNAAGVVTGTPTFAVTLDKANTTLSANATGTASLTGNDVMYTVSGVALQTVTVKGVGNTADEVPANWELASGATVETDNMAEPDFAVGTEKKIINGTSGFFANAAVNGAYAYGAKAFDSVSGNGVTLSGTQDKGVDKSSDNASIVYKVGTKDVKTVDIGTVEWGGEALDGSSADYNYAGAAFGTDNFVISNPDQVEVDTSMTLLKANETLAAMAEETKKASFVYSPVSGVRIDGDITGTMSRSGNNIMFAATENKASQLTFTNVEWKDTLMTRPANIVFDGAKVVTTDIKFTNIDSQVADQTMTLVKNFDGTPSAIEGDHYMVGSGRMGEGAAEMSGNDLIFRAKTGTAPTEATHETVMAMEAGTAVVAAGREYVDSAVEGLGLVSNMAPDGTSTFASMGGGVGRYKTGSHVDTHTWSAVVAVGSKQEHKKGNLEWGVFAEYGRGNYTLHDDNGGRGDGDTNYAGGGLLAKWTNKHDVYTEASVRMGRMSDSASNMLMDRLGNSYGYDIHANYFGAHVGLGKIIKVKKNRDLDVYGKYFYLRRNGVDFDAGGNHYTLDSVTSSLLRIGARYGSNDKKWNWYGGLAYEYEFGGESKGTVDGLAIRSASIKGGSVRGEIGMRMEATKTNPWKVDIGIYGYGGKHRGFGGNVSVAYMF